MTVKSNLMPLLVSLLAFFSLYVMNFKDELDAMSFIIAELSKVVIWDTFPSRDLSDLARWRYVVELMNMPNNLIHYDKNVVKVDANAGLLDNGEFLKVRIYRHKDAAGKLPVIVWYHGGGFVVGGVVADDTLCADMVVAADAVVVNVEYRMAPEYVFPIPIRDSAQALDWVRLNIDKFGGDSNKIFLAGESAGANIASVLAGRNLDENYVPLEQRASIRGVVLVYPPTDIGGDWPSAREYDQVNGILRGRQAKFFASVYAGGYAASAEKVQELRHKYHFSPYFTPSPILEQYPESIFVLAKYDILLDEGLAFAQKLREHGRRVDVTIYNSTIHYFFGKHMFWHGHSSLVDACNKVKAIAAKV